MVLPRSSEPGAIFLTESGRLRYSLVAMSHKKKAAPKMLSLVKVNTRLFAEDVAKIQKIAAERSMPWQIELRQFIHAAMKNAVRDVLVLKEQP